MMMRMFDDFFVERIAKASWMFDLSPLIFASGDRVESTCTTK